MVCLILVDLGSIRPMGDRPNQGDSQGDSRFGDSRFGYLSFGYYAMALSPAALWAFLGVVLCLMEILIPSAFTESALGIAAFGVAIVALIIPQLWIQVLLWFFLSTVLLLFFYRLSRGRRNRSWRMDAVEAKTLTSIPPGDVGRVIYEGGSWQARSYDPELAIAANQAVNVVRQEGNTLIVMPEGALLE